MLIGHFSTGGDCARTQMVRPVVASPGNFEHNIRALIASECEALSVSVQQSTIRNTRASLVLFASKILGNGAVIIYYYGSLVYSNLSSRTQQHRTYWEGFMGMRVDKFEKCDIQLDRPCLRLDGKGREVWVIFFPAKLCPEGNIKGPRYLTVDH